ncbi:hypothetical protein FZ025_12570 [Xanthomonas hyacinthi]|uniref:hypothetical protein n=1 Tax=Xanthomonas hyacinthi TaxID=56455 RepID=UPI000AEA651C|nr:hypothetical protein [Xanthomonas hyacinthi]QGY77425.1 hypothetical protein FZ025_12570 [Xanthomonas hyacinthi]
MSEVTAGIRRDEYGNPIGSNVTVKNDQWTYGASAQTDQAEIYVQNSPLRTTVKYDPNGIGAMLSGGIGDLDFAMGFNTSGALTGSATAKFGSQSVSVTPDGVTGRFEHQFDSGKLTGSLDTNNVWSLNFAGQGSGWGYAITSSYNSGSGYSLFGSIFNIGF